MEQRMPKTIAVFLTAITLAGCATPMTKGSHCIVEPGFLDDHVTYSWYSDPPIALGDATGYISPAMVDVLLTAVVNELRGKGFMYIDPVSNERSSDVKMAISLKTRRELHAITYGESPCTHSDCWERIDMGDSTRMDIRTMGFLSADAYHEDNPIWRGWVERPLYPADRDNAGIVISEAVPALFESFPP